MPVTFGVSRRVTPMTTIRTADHMAIRNSVMRAASVAAAALTDADSDPEHRLRALMEGHGRVLTARGPGQPMTFDQFQQLLLGDLAALLPSGVPAEEMDGLRLIDEDNEFDPDMFDLDVEQRMVLQALRRAGYRGQTVGVDALDQELDQTRAHRQMTSTDSQDDYVAWRSALIEEPAGSVRDLRMLNLPATLTEFYQPIPFDATYDRWWFRCPVCRWPMKITVHGTNNRRTGQVRCFHRPHVEAGASYEFKIPAEGSMPHLNPVSTVTPARGNAAVLACDPKPPTPEPILTDGHKALVRGVWRCTTIPGLPELGLFKALSVPHVRDKGVTAHLWPVLDSYDLLVAVPDGNGGCTEFRVDVKDYTYATLLADKINADGGDSGGAQWLVVPDSREKSVSMLDAVCRQYGMRALTAGDFGAMVCEMVGEQWTS
ncbi:hypothetical protein [Kitasatospora sp. NPDC056181]|uniref:restriction endonuclease-related protein n=1 Tax=Kitasatospora sp. NPDC056181 TaxID=3345737 RepID=UPI0035D7D853